MSTAAMRTFRIFLVVLVQRENCFEGFMAIKANIIINGHGIPPVGNADEGIVVLSGSVQCDLLIAE